jgi:hypothetical protein
MTSGCGTLLYPERKGQPKGEIDWLVFGLDAVGLLLFVVPGIIAFAIDARNGTLYLPADGYGFDSDSSEEILSVSVPENDFHREGIEEEIRRQTGRSVSLSPGNYRTRSLDRVNDLSREARVVMDAPHMADPHPFVLRSQSPSQ